MKRIFQTIGLLFRWLIGYRPKQYRAMLTRLITSNQVVVDLYLGLEAAVAIIDHQLKHPMSGRVETVRQALSTLHDKVVIYGDQLEKAGAIQRKPVQVEESKVIQVTRPQLVVPTPDALKEVAH